MVLAVPSSPFFDKIDPSTNYYKFEGTEFRDFIDSITTVEEDQISDKLRKIWLKIFVMNLSEVSLLKAGNRLWFEMSPNTKTKIKKGGAMGFLSGVLSTFSIDLSKRTDLKNLLHESTICGLTAPEDNLPEIGVVVLLVITRSSVEPEEPNSVGHEEVLDIEDKSPELLLICEEVLKPIVEHIGESPF